VLTSLLDRDPIQIVRLILLAILGGLCLWLTIAIAVQKTQDQSDLIAIEQVQSPAAVRFNWFGVAPLKEEDSAISKELEIANINAKLLGILMAGADSTATIKYSGAPESVYLIGDELSRNITILDIQPYRVVISQNGVKKQIVMEKRDSVIQSEQGPATSRKGVNNGFALANMFGAVPVMVGGSTGFKINDLSSEVQQLADIQEGDVVTKVNGTSIQAIMGDPSQWMAFSASTNLPVTVVRNGQEQIIYINASSLSAKMLPNLGFKP
jgi:type II secretory pathway component PulC